MFACSSVIYVFSVMFACSSVIYVFTIGSIGRKEMFYLATHSTHFIYGYMALDI